jgi:hypothetical protein
VGRIALAGALATCAACATTSQEDTPKKKDKTFKHYVAAYEAALEAHDVDPPTTVKTVADIRLYAKVHGLLRGCVPGRAPEFTVSWSQDFAGRSLKTSQGEKTLGELTQTCRQMFEALDKKPVDACGARYVQLERKLRDDDAYGKPRIAKTSEGWYMSPCENPPGRPLGKDMKPFEAKIYGACEDDNATLYVLSPWAEDDERRMVSTVVCMSERKQRTGWLPGNPGLGVK